MRRDRMMAAVGVVTLTMFSGALARAVSPGSPQAAASSSDTSRVERGAYIVRSFGCNDCHTPWIVGPRGPEPDMSRALTGHPADVILPPPPALPPGPWIATSAATNTAFAGPWGVSFAANLTPDAETGLGAWTGEMFIQAIRTGRHEGKGRPILPPMPAPMIRNMTDEDLLSIFAYLQSLKPVRNRVPQPIDPPEAQ